MRQRSLITSWVVAVVADWAAVVEEAARKIRCESPLEYRNERLTNGADDAGAIGGGRGIC